MQTQAKGRVLEIQLDGINRFIGLPIEVVERGAHIAITPYREVERALGALDYTKVAANRNGLTPEEGSAAIDEPFGKVKQRLGEWRTITNEFGQARRDARAAFFAFAPPSPQDALRRAETWRRYANFPEATQKKVMSDIAEGRLDVVRDDLASHPLALYTPEGKLALDVRTRQIEKTHSAELARIDSDLDLVDAASACIAAIEEKLALYLDDETLRHIRTKEAVAHHLEARA